MTLRWGTPRLAPISQNFTKPENPGFPVFPKIRQRPPPAVHAGPPSSDAPGAFRARTAKQNAPRARGWSNWRSVVRFVSRFSREKLRGHLKRGGPHVQRGEDFGGFWGKLENPGFQVLGKSDKLATPPRVRRGTVQTADSRARPIKNVPAGPDASGSPTEASGPAGSFFIGRARESAV